MSAPAYPSEPDAVALREASVGDLLGRIGKDSSLLVRQEIQLAKAEVTAQLTSIGVGLGLVVVAGVLLLAAVGAGTTAAIAGIHNELPTWLSALIVLGGLVVVATIVGLVGALKLKSGAPPVPSRAIAVAKETPHELAS